MSLRPGSNGCTNEQGAAARATVGNNICQERTKVMIELVVTLLVIVAILLGFWGLTEIFGD